MKLYKKLILSLIILLISIVFTNVNAQLLNPRVNQTIYPNANVIEKWVQFRLTSSQLTSGDSIVFYNGQDAILEQLIVTSNPYSSAYTSGSNDTVKVYTNMGSEYVNIGYLQDTIFLSNNRRINKGTSELGNISGNTYYILIPSGKFSGGDAYYDVRSKFIVIW